MRNFLKVIKQHKILAIGIGVFILLFVLLEKLYLAKLDRSIKNLVTQKESLLKEKQELEGVLSSLEKENVKTKSSALKNILLLKTRILDYKQNAMFLKEITDFNEVTFENITPAKFEKTSTIGRWIINVGIRGSYLQIKNYIEYLNKLPYIININRLELNKGNNKQANRAQITLEVICR
jgi:Tfp pilus assembly protein PilO